MATGRVKDEATASAGHRLTLTAGRVMQLAYVVPDIEVAMNAYRQEMDIGPWFAFRNFQFAEIAYRGGPCLAKTTVAIAYSGEMMYELIQQHDELPSVYMDVIKVRGYGFHHFCLPVISLDAEIQKYRGRGYETAFLSRSLNGIRAAYMDTQSSLPGMLELIEISEPALDVFGMAYEAAQSWDRVSDPVRWF